MFYLQRRSVHVQSTSAAPAICAACAVGGFYDDQMMCYTGINTRPRVCHSSICRFGVDVD